jgi:hypothetical protein
MIVKKEKTDEEMEKLKNTKITKEMIKTIITTDTDVYNEEGKLLLRYKKGIIKGGSEYYKNVKPFMDKHPSTNRGSASGGKKMNVKDNPKIKTAIIGYFDKWSPKQKYLFKKLGMKVPLEVRETMYNIDEEEGYKKIIPYIRQIDAAYKKYIPEKYKNQRKKADETEFKIDGTAFTTVTTNINFQTTIHKDTGDDANGYGNLSVIEKGSYEGGETCLPQYGIGVNVREGDILLMDVHEWHGNLPIKLKEPTAERMSIVCYLRENVWKRTRKKTKAYRERHNKSLRGMRGKLASLR